MVYSVEVSFSESCQSINHSKI